MVTCRGCASAPKAPQPTPGPGPGPGPAEALECLATATMLPFQVSSRCSFSNRLINVIKMGLKAKS